MEHVLPRHRFPGRCGSTLYVPRTRASYGTFYFRLKCPDRVTEVKAALGRDFLFCGGRRENKPQKRGPDKAGAELAGSLGVRVRKQRDG